MKDRRTHQYKATQSPWQKYGKVAFRYSEEYQQWALRTLPKYKDKDKDRDKKPA